MPRQLAEAIFNSKNNINDFYPQFAGTPSFDLERKHLFYGRIDKNSDAVYVDGANLQQIYTGMSSNTEFAIDFVSDAFDDLRRYVQKMANSDSIERNSPYSSIVATKGWRHGDLQHSYNQHMNGIYTDFVQEYLRRDRRHDSVKNFTDFVKEFLLYAIQIARSFPVTRTGYILSAQCTPFVSGLMVEIANVPHGTDNNAAILNYIEDPNFTFFVRTAQKFGFMVDKNAPWRLVFNIASGTASSDGDSPSGAQKYMQQYGVSYENIFKFYYEKAYETELMNLKKQMASMYEAFYLQYNTYEKLTETGSSKTQAGPFQNCHKVKLTSNRKDRDVPPVARNPLTGELEFTNAFPPDEYWLKMLLKLRFVETGFHHDAHDFQFFVKRTIRNHRLFGPESSLEYINSLTRGIPATKFITKGKYWHGEPGVDYEKKALESKQNSLNPARVDLALTGVLGPS